MDALILTPREGCPYGKTCRAVGLRPPLRRHAKRTGIKREHVIARRAQPDVAIPEIERSLPLVVPAKSRGLPRRAVPSSQ